MGGCKTDKMVILLFKCIDMNIRNINVCNNTNNTLIDKRNFFISSIAIDSFRIIIKLSH